MPKPGFLNKPAKPGENGAGTNGNGGAVDTLKEG